MGGGEDGDEAGGEVGGTRGGVTAAAAGGRRPRRGLRRDRGWCGEIMHAQCAIGAHLCGDFCT